MKRLALDVEYTNYSGKFSPFMLQDKLLTVAAFDGKKNYFWNINHPEAPKDNLDQLYKFLGDKDLEIEAHNGKSDFIWLEVSLDNFNVLEETAIKGKLFDSMNASNLLHLVNRDKGEKNDLETISLKLNPNIEPWKQKIDIKKLEFESFEKIREYNIQDAFRTFHNCTKLRNLLNKKPKIKALFELEMQCIKVLIAMEKRGILLDKVQLYRAGKYMYSEMQKVQKYLDKTAGYEININSPKQLCTFLFEELGMPCLMVSQKTGEPSADEISRTMSKWEIKRNEKRYAGKDTKLWLKILEQIDTYKGFSKNYSSFVFPMPEYLEYDGRVHPRFNLGKGFGVDPKHETGARTGRLSCSDPNLQQQPKIELMRSNYIAKQHCKFLDSDFKQLEMVVAAFYSQEPALMEAVIKGLDMHTKALADTEGLDYKTLIEILNNKTHPKYEKMKQGRIEIKPVNFGILFGIGEQKLHQQYLNDFDLFVPVKECGARIERWFETYPKVKEYVEKTKAEARQGYVTTATGMIIPTPFCKDRKDWGLIARNERQAVNGKIQSLAADICKISMLLYEIRMPNRLLLQVHDSLLGEFPIEEVTEAKKKIEQVMTKDSIKFLKDIFNVNFNLPLAVDIKESRKWLP